MFPLTKKEASLILCASPPERVEDDCPSLTYPNVDGGMGPKTIAAMDGVELQRVRAYRVKYYADLVTRKPDLEKFYFGWFRRALEV